MDALLEGTQQQLKITPIRYGHCVVLQLDDTFEILEHKKPHLLIIRKNSRERIIKKNILKKEALAVCSSGSIVD